MSTRETMPIMGSKIISEIPWGMVSPHRTQAQDNHGQSLEQLASRGGLSASEAIAIIQRRKWGTVKACPENEQYLVNLVKLWRGKQRNDAADAEYNSWVITPWDGHYATADEVEITDKPASVAEFVASPEGEKVILDTMKAQPIALGQVDPHDIADVIRSTAQSAPTPSLLTVWRNACESSPAFVIGAAKGLLFKEPTLVRVGAAIEAAPTIEQMAEHTRKAGTMMALVEQQRADIERLLVRRNEADALLRENDTLITELRNTIALQQAAIEKLTAKIKLHEDDWK